MLLVSAQSLGIVAGEMAGEFFVDPRKEGLSLTSVDRCGSTKCVSLFWAIQLDGLLTSHFSSDTCAIGYCQGGRCPGLGYSTDGKCGKQHGKLVCGGPFGDCCSNEGK